MNIPKAFSAAPHIYRSLSALAPGLAVVVCLLLGVACQRSNEKRLQPAEGKVRILMYHHIGQACTNRWWVPTADFAAQLAFLREQGYKSVLPADLVEHQAGRRQLPKQAVLLTFDDGGADLLTEAEPLLREHGFTGVVYLITSLVAAEGEERGEYEGVPCLTWPEVNELAKGGVLVPGGHTRTSPDLRRTRKLTDEITGCREDIRRNTGYEPDSFCYPFGRYTSNAVAAVAAAGFTTALTCEPAVARINQDISLLELPRLHVVGGESLDIFANKLTSIP